MSVLKKKTLFTKQVVAGFCLGIIVCQVKVHESLNGTDSSDNGKRRDPGRKS